MNHKKIKLQVLSLFILSFLFISNSAFSQVENSDAIVEVTNSFRIINQGKVNNIQLYVDALNNANLDKYRMFDKRRILQFDTGVKIELYSVNELKEKGTKYDESKIKDGDYSTVHHATFKLNESGHILELHSCPAGKKPKKCNK